MDLKSQSADSDHQMNWQNSITGRVTGYSEAGSPSADRFRMAHQAERGLLGNFLFSDHLSRTVESGYNVLHRL